MGKAAGEPAEEEGLSAKRQRFVEEYCIDMNATQAAIRAGYSARTAEQQGSRLLGNVEVAAAVRAGRAKLSDQTTYTKVQFVEKLIGSLNSASAKEHYAGVGRLGELLSRLNGWIVEPPRTMRVIRSVEDLTEAELIALSGEK